MDVIFRVDASQQIGAGHVVRCLTLADGLKARGVRCVFLCRHLTEGLGEMIVSKGHELVSLASTGGTGGPGSAAQLHPWLGIAQEEDARQALAALAGRSCEWLVVDHYALDVTWERLLRPAIRHLLVIDDLADRHHDCDALLDQNLYSDAQTRYVGLVPETCRLLLGPKFALLREEFRRARGEGAPRSGPVRRILVFFGGVDAANRTALTLTALGRPGVPPVAVDVVIGAGHPARREIEAACASGRFVLHVQTDRMAELMAAADLAVGAGGSATWERCCVGLPTLAVSVAANQERLVIDGALAGALCAPQGPLEDPDDMARHVRSLIENPLLRESISRRGMDLVDGRGTSRVLRALGVVFVVVRPAVAEDAADLFEWRNHPAIRAVSRSTAPLDWSTHARWFESIRADATKMLLVGETAGRPVGVVRFDMTADAAEVSIYTVQGPDRHGAGADLLAAAERWLSATRPEIRHLNAAVLADNVPSHRLFSSSGYLRCNTTYTKWIARADS